MHQTPSSPVPTLIGFSPERSHDKGGAPSTITSKEEAAPEGATIVSPSQKLGKTFARATQPPIEDLATTSTCRPEALSRHDAPRRLERRKRIWQGEELPWH